MKGGWEGHGNLALFKIYIYIYTFGSLYITTVHTNVLAQLS